MREDAKIKPGSEITLKLMNVNEKLLAAKAWCAAEYGDACIMYDILNNIEAQMDVCIEESFAREGGRS
jgi:hypothetical protein